MEFLFCLLWGKTVQVPYVSKNEMAAEAVSAPAGPLGPRREGLACPPTPFRFERSLGFAVRWDSAGGAAVSERAAAWFGGQKYHPS